MLDGLQISVFVGLLALIALLTWLHCRDAGERFGGEARSAHDYFLAGGGLNWVFVAGSITLTNLSTDQLVGMNGNQMLLLAWWELAAVAGLMILTFVFLPIYYRNHCTTTTELLEKRYNNKEIRALIAVLFLAGNIFIFLPAVLYSGALFMQSMFGVTLPIFSIAVLFAIVGAAYAILGGLRAVAVSDTYSGVGLLAMAVIVVFLALRAVDFDIATNVPIERLSLIGRDGSPIPWHTLLTGMILIQTFYWSTNQTITQRAMAAPSIKEAQRGVLAAAGIRLLVVPVIVTVPGVVAFKLYGDIGDAAYGQLVGDILPGWLSGAFAAMMAAAVLTTFNSILNSSAALYVCDLHQTYVSREVNVPRLSGIVSGVFVLAAIALVPVFATAESIINLLQKLYGLLSMPILSAFVVGLVFRNVHAFAAIAGIVTGVAVYASFIFHFQPERILAFHEIHAMALTFLIAVGTALGVNAAAFGRPVALRVGDPAAASSPS